jgi:hypothetical protein
MLVSVANSAFPKDAGAQWVANDFTILRSCDKFSEELHIILSREARKGIGKPMVAHEMAKAYSKEDVKANTALKNTFDKLTEIVRGA